MIAGIRKLLQFRLFTRKQATNMPLAIVGWWELRRIPYNLIVGACGIFTSVITIIVAAIASEHFNEPLGLPDPPAIAFFAVLFYGAMANICYTGGWITEISVRAFWREQAGEFGQIAFALGLLFSILLTLAPAALFSFLLILRLLLE